MVIFDILKEFLANEYDIKDLGEAKTIIGWQINRDVAMGTKKIDQSAFIKDTVIEKRLSNCNANVIPMKAGLSIDMGNPEDYKETNLWMY